MHGAAASGPIGRWAARAVVAALMAATMVGVGARAAGADDEVDTLREEAATTYTLVEGESHVEVAIDLTITNKKPRSGHYIYYYSQYALGLPGTATDVAVTSDGQDLDFTVDVVASESEFDEEDPSEFLFVTIDLPRRIFYDKSVDLRVEFNVWGAEPRSWQLTRINPAYVIFGAYAWGDPGLGSVDVVIGPGWDVDVYGDMALRFEDGARVYRATAIDDPLGWYALVEAHNDDAREVQTFDFEGIEVDVLAWPGDDEWAADAASWVQEGFPLLAELVGIDVREGDAELDIFEAAEPEYLGYAGWYVDDDDLIELGEHADAHVLLHEMSHLWFDDTLFEERWIAEGLADQVAAEVVERLDLVDRTEFPEPEEPEWRKPWSFPLNEWVTPGEAPAGDFQVQQTESFGYEGSWWVVRTLYQEIGAGAMTEVLQAAEADLTPYQGSGEREVVDVPDDWRQFLDLLQEVGGSEQAEEVFTSYVLTDEQIELLDDRSAARDAYYALVEADGPWETPAAIRHVMARWRFDTAMGWIDEAQEVLDLWAEVEATAAAMGLTPPGTMQAPYEAMTTRFDEATAAGQAHLDTMAALADARGVVGAERDFATRIGLRGKDPEGLLAAADAAYEQGDFAAAEAHAADAVALVDDAPRLGGERIKWFSVAAGGALLLVLALLALLIVWLVRRRRRRTADAAPGGGDGEVAAGDEEGADGGGGEGEAEADPEADPAP
ncbi:MAG: hypothetical protein KQH83_12205 [Actinobacteria bacterium]|nr:hypothetical protein [Actinomycetota bacterium]